MSGKKMCNKNSPDMKTRSMTKKEKARGRVRVREPLKPARKSRTKTRKPKFLSLRLELSSENSNTTSSTQMIENHKTNCTHQQQQQQQQQQQNQLNLFPLHPENLVEDKDIHDENVAFLFNSTESGGASLNFLGSSSEEDSLSPPTPSLTYPYGSEEANNNGDCSNYSASRSKLLRTAMRIKERDPSKEKWVCYSEVVEKKQKVELEEVSSCTKRTMTTTTTMKTQGLLSLKLDYQGIMNAWSDKGPLFIEGESPQTVPVLHDEANVLVDGWGSVGNIWRVPEMGSNDDIGCRMKVKEEELELELKGKDGWKMRHREASVLRYKEKRQNRLFSKRIRYEVRKLNAEKRPRMKGRFVKRS